MWVTIIRMTHKLTLSVDSEVIARAKRYARRQGTSVSRLVETFLTLASRPTEKIGPPPVLRRLRGSLQGVDAGDYRRYLREKYK